MTHESHDVIADLTKLCEEYKTECLVHVGSWDAYEAVEIRKATGCHVVAIDGDSRAPFPIGISGHHAVIGSSNCMVDFYVCGCAGLSGKIERNDQQITEQRLEQHRLDTFCEYHRIAPDALIIDTEGTTLDVLRGCGAVLDSVRLIYAECQFENLDEVDEFLAQRGFRQREGPPAYDVGNQGNYTWVRHETER